MAGTVMAPDAPRWQRFVQAMTALVDATDDEEGRYGCGRPGCCLGAFKCRLCGQRLLARFPAPEME